MAAGLGRTAIAKPLKIWPETVGQWDRGKRPAWRYMPALSKLLGIELNEAVRMMWGEIVGDSCPCQCGGEKVFPDYDGALHLSIRLPLCKMRRRAPAVSHSAEACEGMSNLFVRAERKIAASTEFCGQVPGLSSLWGESPPLC